jgi:protein ImuA
MRTEAIASLRARVAALERGLGAAPSLPCLPFGISELDGRLPGRGLALGAVHEVFAGGPAVEHGAAPALFAAGVLARRPGPVVWIIARRDLYPPALARAGLDPGRIVFVEARHGALRAMEESLRHPGLAGVACEHGGRLDLTASRRLQLAAEGTGALGFVLRRSRRFDDPALDAPSAASTRWRITGLPSRPLLPHAPDVPGLGRPVWRLDLLRCRGAQAASIIVEAPDAQGRLAVPSYLADRPAAAPRLRRTAGGAALGHAGA